MSSSDRLGASHDAGIGIDDTAHLRVLVIDDDVEDAAITQRALLEIPWFTCAIDSANSYGDALQALTTQVYDVILLDHGLGVRSGLELLEEAFGGTLPVAVVLLTGMASHAVDEAASRAGISHLLEKSELRTGKLDRSVRYALERTRSEQELRSARAFFRSAFDALSDHVAILDEHGTIVEVNRAWQVFAAENGHVDAFASRGENYLLECDAASKRGDPLAAEVAAGLRAVIAGTEDSFRTRYSCHSPDADCWFDLHATRIPMNGAHRVMVAHHNVTEQLRTERALRDSADRYRLLFNSNPFPLWVAEESSKRCISANDAALAQYGYTLDEFLELTAYDIRIPEQRDALAAIAFGLRPGLTKLGGVKHRTKTGKVIDVEVVLHSIELDGTKCQMVLAMDITDRMRMERASANALAEADLERRRLQATLAAMPVGVFITDASGTLLHGNAEAQKIWAGTNRSVGSPASPGMQQAWFSDSGEELKPEDWAASIALGTGEAVNGQLLQIARLDGTRGHILNSAAPIRDSDGRITGTVIVNVDLTDLQEKERERTQLFESLEFERKRLSVIFAQAPAFMAVMRGARNVFEMVNEEFVRLVGRNPLASPGAEAIPEAAEQGFFRLVDHVRETGRPYVGMHAPTTLSVRAGEAHTYVVNFVLQPLAEEDGQVTGVLLHGVDVTKEVASADALRQSEEQYRTLVELSPDGILVHVDGVIVFANGSAARILNADSPSDLIGRPLLDFAHPKFIDQMRARLAQLWQGGTLPSAQVQWVTIDGATRDMDISSSCFDLGGGLAVQTVFRDTTVHRHLEEQLRQAHKMEAVGQLAGGVAHDFNNLLTVIKVSVAFLLEDLTEDDPHRGDVIEVRDAAERAAALTRQLLAFSRKQILQTRVFDLNSVLLGVKPMLSRLIPEDIVVEQRLGATSGLIAADPGQIEQVIINLVVNARDAMPTGGRLVIETAEVTLLHEEETEGRSLMRAGAYVTASVRDTGTGISPEVRAHIFEPFFTTKPAGYGTGLGLATAYGIVKQSGGYLLVDSEVGRGSLFTIFLPIVEQPLTTVHESAPVRRTTGTETILLVEDMDAVREIAERVLARSGYTVLEARNGKDALAVASAYGQPIHLLITDIVMPEMGGLQLVENLKLVRPDMVVLFMSGYAEDDATRRELERSRAGFVPKPFSPSQLLEQVRSALDALAGGPNRVSAIVGSH
ncbi:MAG: PAS domain S-box protein [bacterium]